MTKTVETGSNIPPDKCLLYTKYKTFSLFSCDTSNFLTLNGSITSRQAAIKIQKVMCPWYYRRIDNNCMYYNSEFYT